MTSTRLSPPLLPNPSSLENDENLSEKKRNSRLTTGVKSLKRQQRKQSSSAKNFMASSKSLNPKKKILEEWKQVSSKKPSILGPKSVSHQVGTSNSVSEICLPKIPSSNFDDNNNNNDGGDDDSFVPDPSIPPYDPVTNYLSPRPKYLRYNPNRRREINLRKEKYGIDDISLSPSVSVESQTQSSAVYYSTAESCYKENGRSEVEELMGEDEEDEEVIEVSKWVLKWEILKVVIVFGVLIFSTIYISSVNSSVPISSVARRRLEIEYHNLGNITFGVGSLRSVAFGNWVFVESGGYEMVMFELDESVVQQEGKSRESDAYEEEDQEIEISENIDHGQIIVKFDTEDDNFQPVMESLKDEDVENEVLIINAQAPDKETEEEYVVFDSMSNDELVEDKVQMVGLELNEVTEEEILANFDEKTDDSEEEIVVEQENVNDHEMGSVDIQPKSKEFEKELVMDVAEDQNDGIVIEAENMVDSEKEMIGYELKSKDSKLENVADIVTEYPIVEILGYNQVWLNLKNMVWFVISSVMTLVTSLLVRFYFKCKKASSKTVPSNVKLCCQPELAEKNSLKLPPKAGEKIEQVLKLQSHSNPTPVIEMNPRFIPRVEVLSEFAIGGDLRNSIKSCTSQANVQECKESKETVRHERSKASHSARAPSRWEPSASEFSMADFLSYETNKCEEKTTTKEDGKEMTKVTPTPLRRSSRIRNRGLTSP